jgi:glycerophosphoryl diester phosphodiesterase
VGKKRILVAAIAGLAGILAALALRRGEARTIREDWPANFAHRGASARAPENTLEAFRLGMEAGAGGLELARGELAAETAPRSPGL